MANCFISYSSADEEMAQWVRSELLGQNVSVFMASASLRPGAKWSTEIRNQLQSSRTVIFLASREACSSPWVQQEMGMALAQMKNVVPIVWDIPPTELPGWTSEFQALDLRNASVAEARTRILAIGENIRLGKQEALILGGILIGAILIWGGE